MRPKFLIVLVLFFLQATSAPQADARPLYLKVFSECYPDSKMTAEQKCGVCHLSDKKMRNAYGDAVRKSLNGKNVKDIEIIMKALKDAEPLLNASEGKTFGDLLKEGKRPGKTIE